MRIARACCTRGGVTTATVLTGAFGCSTAAADFFSASVEALPTEENLPVATHAAKQTSTISATSLWNLIFGIVLFQARPGQNVFATARTMPDMGA